MVFFISWWEPRRLLNIVLMTFGIFMPVTTQQVAWLLTNYVGKHSLGERMWLVRTIVWHRMQGKFFSVGLRNLVVLIEITSIRQNRKARGIVSGKSKPAFYMLEYGQIWKPFGHKIDRPFLRIVFHDWSFSQDWYMIVCAYRENPIRLLPLEQVSPSIANENEASNDDLPKAKNRLGLL